MNTEIFETFESNVRSYCRSFPTVFTRAKGAIMQDEDGKEYIDFFAGAGALNFGHNPDEMVRRVCDYLQNDGIVHSMDMYTAPKREFLESFPDHILAPRGLAYTIQFAGPTGTNAVECATKLARKVKGRENIFAFMGAFHGMTLGSLALTTDRCSRDGAGQILPNVTHIPAPYMFPELDTDAAIEALWQLIFDTCRVTGGDPVGEWQEHLARLSALRDKMNALDLESVHFASSNGTDLTVGIADQAVWESAASKNEKGITFLPNIPTEEVFTAPHKDKVNGVVYGTKPYVFNGQLIKGFHVTFKDGKVVEHGAEEGADLLGQLLDTDEGARHIGEVALVPASSPINRCGKLFYNTLFDENAACHIAFGDSYPGTTAGGTGLTRDQLDARGMNHSSLHEDVMIGAEDSEITGKCRDGRTVQLFQNGVWVL